jgi:hypothetical protein
MITHVIGNQNYDDVVADKRQRAEALRYLEVTTTLKTYEDSLRMEVLSKEGSVAAYGPVTAEGPRYRRISIKARGIALEHKVIRADHLKLIQEAVERKARKRYEPNEGSNGLHLCYPMAPLLEALQLQWLNA